MFSEDFQIIQNKEYSISYLEIASDFINSDQWVSSKDLYNKLFKKGKSITKKFGSNTSLVFVILKVLKTIRVECARVLSGNPELEEQTNNLLFADEDVEVKDVPRDILQEFIAEALIELRNEISEALKLVSECGADMIIEEDIIVTYGYSDLVIESMQHAVNLNRSFLVIVLEGHHNGQGAQMADKLSRLGIQVVLAPEKCSYTLMKLASKVIIESESAFIDGGHICVSGTHRICLDAKAHAIPVFVCLPSSRLSPLPSCDYMDNRLNDDFSEDICIAYHADLMPSNLIDKLITNLGLLDGSQLMSIAGDCFCSHDVRRFLTAL